MFNWYTGSIRTDWNALSTEFTRVLEKQEVSAVVNRISCTSVIGWTRYPGPFLIIRKIYVCSLHKSYIAGELLLEYLAEAENLLQLYRGRKRGREQKRIGVFKPS